MRCRKCSECPDGWAEQYGEGSPKQRTRAIRLRERWRRRDGRPSIMAQAVVQGISRSSCRNWRGPFGRNFAESGLGVKLSPAIFYGPGNFSKSWRQTAKRVPRIPSQEPSGSLGCREVGGASYYRATLETEKTLGHDGWMQVGIPENYAIDRVLPRVRVRVERSLKTEGGRARVLKGRKGFRRYMRGGS